MEINLTPVDNVSVIKQSLLECHCEIIEPSLPLKIAIYGLLVILTIDLIIEAYKLYNKWKSS